MSVYFLTLSFEQISTSLEWNLHPWTLGSKQETLINSIKKLGIVIPPLLIEGENNQYVVVSGHRRIKLAREILNQKNFDCRIIQKNISDNLLFGILLEDMKNGPKISLAEKACFLSIASKYFGTNDLAKHFFKQLEIKRKPSFVDELLRLLEKEQNFIDAVHTGLIEESMISELLQLHSKERDAVLTLFDSLSLGGSKQKKLLNLVRDAAYKDESSIHEFMLSEEITAILSDDDLNVPLKIQHLDRILQIKIKPNSHRAEANFLEQVKDLKLAENQKITHSPSFERDTVTLLTEFASLEDCRSFLKNTDS